MTTTTSFEAATTWTPDGQGAWRGEVPAAWMQGRAAFGGVVTAAALRALRAEIGHERPLRSLTASFIAPVQPGEAQARAQVLRAGRALSHGEARVEQEGTTCAVLLGAFGEDRPSGVVVEGARVTPPCSPDAVQDMPYIEGVVPRFVQSFHLRWAEGDYPFSGSAQGSFGGWCRHRTEARGVEGLIGLLDAWPAPVLPMLKGPAPASTVRWATHIVGDVDAAMAGWCWFTSRAISAGGGYASTLNHLYSEDGALIAWTEQLVAIFDR
jgi:acyl-CoA thioesterase